MESICTAPIYPSVDRDACKAKEELESEKVIRRLHEVNENLGSIAAQLREFEDRILGDCKTTSSLNACESVPSPRPVFLDKTHSILDDTFNYIASIRQTITKLQRF